MKCRVKKLIVKIAEIKWIDAFSSKEKIENYGGIKLKRIINLLLIMSLLLQILVIPVYAADVSQSDIRGTVWNIDVNKTTAANDCSMRILFGTAWVEYGDEMKFYADNSFSYYIGAGIGGKGTYSVNNEISYEIVTYEEELIENGVLSFEDDCIVQRDEEVVIYWKKTEDLIPSDAEYFNGSYYKIYDNDCETWLEAQNYCNSLGGDLAVITSEEENDFLYGLMIRSGYKNAYFGLTDREKEGIWQWVNDEKVNYTNWHSGEPNGENQNEDYAMFYYKFSDGTWNDGDFGERTVNGGQTFICEWRDESIKVKLNGNEIHFDEEPLMINDRVMVPMRKIFEELGATVEWEEDTQTVTAIRGITFVKIAIGSNTLSITGVKNENISLDSPAQLINGRTYVPVRAVSEALNTVVSWNGDEQTVYISTFDGNKNIAAAIVNADSELTINDAALFREVLLKNKLGNVYEENISAVTEPSESGFDVLIRRLVSLADDDDISYFFYTGHGGHSNNEVVIAPDYSSVSSGTYEYTMSELIERLDDVRGTVVVILDSCYSGAINDLDFDRNKFKIITACSSDEYSFTENILSGIATLIFNDSVINGKFSSVMLNGLGAYEGGGVFNKYNEKVKADYDKDHNVTVAELYKYIEENIDKKSKDRDGNIFYQNPTCSDREDETIIYSY